ncbi:TrkH family potassium uptake protein [Roseivirga sp. E12]|uniref:TrkH family potassium uptake protein n=1 Tax=Roseivirga sp. E12 TaxID=2819237 RepID=UPI001ABC6925|nr:TrkH family potassium uptake protein [Roseivirga sp. E12]MBO3700575.1 TrkH family potassium uptake protein [Roseivirga sp. E12]
MRFNLKVIGDILGILLLINGGFMALCLPISLYYGEHDWIAILTSSLVTLGSGFLLRYLTRNKKSKELKKKDGYLIVTAGWIFMSIFGALPYIISGSIPNFTDAFFETISGYTTTGASILTDIEAVPNGILFWRSLTQWIGGMGIIVLALAILPFLGIGGMQLFVAEAPGITPDKLQPRIQETAKRLWFLYVGLTLAEAIALYVAGMGPFDAINHSLTTMATGGFSTKNDSLQFVDPVIQYIVIFFMFLAGTSFTLTYFGLKRNFKKVFKNEEFLVYLTFTAVITVIVTVTLLVVNDKPFENSFRDALFQVVSLITTTGFVSADYTSWTPFLSVLFFILLFVGGSAGSTAGGVKVIRHVVLFKNSFLELKRQLHPSAVMPVRISGKAVEQSIVYNVLAFIMIYILVFLVGVTLLSSMNVDFDTAFGAVATSLGNVGPGIGDVGPLNNFAGMPTAGKWLLSALMLLGRLELFTVLMLLSPHFWRKR